MEAGSEMIVLYFHEPTCPSRLWDTDGFLYFEYRKNKYTNYTSKDRLWHEEYGKNCNKAIFVKSNKAKIQYGHHPKKKKNVMES